MYNCAKLKLLVLYKGQVILFVTFMALVSHLFKMQHLLFDTTENRVLLFYTIACL